MWSLFVQYPNREQVLREFRAPPSLGELRDALEVFDDQQLLVADEHNKVHFSPLVQAEQLYDGASLRVAVPRRRIFVSLADGAGRSRLVVWYPGTGAQEIERAIVRACGLPAGTAIELIDGDVAVVISATIPSDSYLTVRVVAGDQSTGSGGYPDKHGSHEHGGAPPQRPGRSAGHHEGVGRAATTTPTVPRSASLRTATSPGHHRGSSAFTPSARGGAATQRMRSATPQGSARAHQPGVCDAPTMNRSASRTGSPVRNMSIDHDANEAKLSAQPSGRTSAPDEHCVHILAGHAGFVLSLCTVGDVLFTGSQDCDIMIWDLNNLQYIGTLPGHRGFVKCMASTMARKSLCSGSQDKTIKIWSLETFTSTKTLVGHTSEVNALTILEGTDVLVSGGADRSIRVWDLASLALIASLEQAHLSGISALVQLDSGLFLSASRDKTVRLWSSSTWQARRTLTPPHCDSVSDIVVGPQSGNFYSASRDKSIKRWGTRTLESDLALARAHGDWLTSLALSPSEGALFSGSKDCVVKVWDTDLRCKDHLLGHRGPISALIALGSHVFSASHDRTVRVWRVDQYESRC